MLSVVNEIDGRRTSILGEGFRGRGRMEENELEEGEAISSLEYDPDLSLSYIDERLQMVLGHFQKDFEGEISAEGSGAKLGEYGSFLPVYVRLPPVCPQQSRVPARVTDRNTAASSQNPAGEIKAASTSPLPSANLAASSLQLDDAKKNKICSVEITQKNGLTKQPNSSGNENQLLKLRIKVGSGNLLSGPLAAIYSDMGLDYSPSSSPEDSPGTSGGNSMGHSPSNSPIAAFQIMTCFPVPDGYLLSPLPESILHLVENGRIYSKYQRLGELSSVERKGNTSERKKGKIAPDSNQKEKQKSKPNASENEWKNLFAEDKHSLADLSDDELLDLVASPNIRRTDEIAAGSKTPSAEDKLNTQKGGLCYDELNPQPDRSLRPHVSSFNEDGEMGFHESETKKKPNHSAISQKEIIDKKKIQLKVENSGKKQVIVRSQKGANKIIAKENQKGLPFEQKSAKSWPKTDLVESPFMERTKENEKNSSGFLDKSNDNQGIKKSEYPLPITVTEDREAVVDATSAPHIVIEDNWVACDKCQQWRLLPYGMDPAQLPKKWLCTMLDWLPGMNKCSFTEEETTRALHAAYQPPLIDNHIVLNDATRLTALDAHYKAENFEKKKLPLKEISSKGTPTAEPAKQQRGASVESLVSRDNLVFSNGPSKASDPTFEDAREKKKKKHRYVEQCAAEDELVSKSKGKRRSDGDDIWVSKKVKSVEACSAGEDGNSFRRKSALITSSGLQSKSPFTDREESGKKSRGVHEKIPSNGVPKHVTSSYSKHEKKIDKEDSSVKKRKEKLDYTKEEEIGRGEPKKEKKARTSKMEEMGTKRDDEIDRRDRGMKRPKKMMEISKKSIKQEQYQGHSEPEQPCAAATSSSSKLSGTSKNKSSIQEMRGSPVDSVSSSPLRIPYAVGPDAVLNGLSESQRRRSNGDVFGGVGQPLNNDAARGKPIYKDKKSDFEENKTAAGDTHQHKSGAGQQKPSTSLSRSKEKPKSSKPISEQYKDKNFDSVGSSQRKNMRLDSTDFRDTNPRTLEKKLPSESPRDIKLKKSETLESLETNERDLRSRDKEVASDSSKMGKISPYADKRASKPEFSPTIRKNLSENGIALAHVDGNQEKLLEQPKILNNQIGKLQNYSATSVLKEARNLKHTANRLKAEGLEQQSTALYFEAALKFLHVALLFETGKHGESMPTVLMYADTARLCQYCAYEYEKSKEMAAAALTYKCTEVAFMKVVYLKNPHTSKDRHDLLTALQTGPSGESPSSSSASDIDNLNNQNGIIKGSSSKVANPSQTVSTHAVATRNRPTFTRLLDFISDVNNAMEASRKSQNAFCAASTGLEGSNYSPEGLASVKRILDLSFHNVEGLLHLIRQSMDSISHWLHHS